MKGCDELPDRFFKDNCFMKVNIYSKTKNKDI